MGSHDIELLEENFRRLLLDLQPADLVAMDDDDANLMRHELLREFCGLARLIPSEKALNDPAHRVEVDAPGKVEIVLASGAKQDLHRHLPEGIMPLLMIGYRSRHIYPFAFEVE